MPRVLWILAGFVACAAACTAPTDEDPEKAGGKSDGGTSSRFVEVDPTHTNLTFRTYVHRALDKLEAHDSELATLTAASIEAGRVRIDELADLTCGDFLRVAKDLPALNLEPSDHALLQRRGSEVTAAISNELDGYMWSNRIYISRGQDPQRLAATLVHEVNHVLNRSEVGYYDDLPTSAFLHEYRAFYAEREFDPAYYEGIDLVDHVIENYELDRTRIPSAVIASPLTPKLLPTTTAWRERRVDRDVEEPASCE
jgi:hypothetical protein